MVCRYEGSSVYYIHIKKYLVTDLLEFRPQVEETLFEPGVRYLLSTRHEVPRSVKLSSILSNTIVLVSNSKSLVPHVGSITFIGQEVPFNLDAFI